MDAADGFIKIIDDPDELILEALNKGDVLATPREGQMLINMTGVSINAKPRRDGRYQGYILCNGQKKYLYGKTREEVATKIKLFFKEEAPPKRKKKEKKNLPTFGEFMEIWISLYKAPKLKASSLQNIRDTLKPALEKFGGDRIDTIKTDALQELLLTIDGGRMRDVCRTNLNQMFKKAVAQGILAKNPCDAIELRKHVYKKKKALTRTEESEFLAAVSTSKHYLLFRFLLASGLRIGEALALHKSDIDAESGTVIVSKNVVFINGKRIEQDTPKTEAGNRTVPITAELCKTLIDIETDILFPVTYNAVRLATERAAKETGLEVTPHILRHTYATRLEQAGIPKKTRQYLLGHADSRMTEDVYTDIQKESIEKAAAIIRDLF